VISDVAVVIPARNEEERIAAALRSVVVAAARCPRPVRIITVCDACEDGTQAAAVAALTAWRPSIVTAVAARNVGAARQAGWELALAGCGGRAGGLWIATTDADGAVPPDWLRHQIELADRGADVVCGTVEVADWSGYPEEVRRRYLAAYATPAGAGHGHVHGANLGIRAGWLRSLGGFPPLTAHEDRTLVRRAGRAGARIVATSRIPVVTSARLDGRSPDGFARLLRTLSRPAGPPAAAPVPAS